MNGLAVERSDVTASALPATRITVPLPSTCTT